MPQEENQPNAQLSPALRARLQKCYEFGNQKMQAGEYDYANEMFSQCYAQAPGNLIYLQSFVANLRMKYGNNKKGASFAKLKGGTARSQLKIAEARSKFEDVLKSGAELLKLNPWDSAVFFSMGKASVALGYDDTGLALLKHAIDSDPNNIEINRYAAKELAQRELFDDAIACCQRILNAKSSDYEASNQMKDLLLQKTMQHMERKKTAAEKEAEKEVLTNYNRVSPLDGMGPACSKAELNQASDLVQNITVSDPVKYYILAIADATRRSDRLRLGISPRGSLALMKASQAWAAMSGRDYVIPDDVKKVAVPVLSHRIITRSQNTIRLTDTNEQVIEAIVDTVKAPVD